MHVRGAGPADATAATTGGAAPSSITHLHLLSAVHTELLESAPSGRPVRVLDVGCGRGVMLAYLQEQLADLFGDAEVEVHGMDVIDHGVQDDGFFEATTELLTARLPDVAWHDRLRAVGVQDPWPYDDGSFDVIVSNQVLEHVDDHARFFAEIRRTLRDGGVSVHLFPLRDCWFEGHLLLPVAHRILDWDLRAAWIRSLSRLGLGKFPGHHRRSGVGLDEYVERHADYVQYYTSYISYRDALDTARSAGLRATFRYTSGFYSQKLRSLAGRPPRLVYRRRRSALADWWATFVLKRISSVTLVLTKRESYRGSLRSHG